MPDTAQRTSTRPAEPSPAAVRVDPPAPGQVVTLAVAAAQVLALGFAAADGQARIDGDTLQFLLRDGGIVNLEGFLPAAASGLPPILVMIDGTRVAGDLLIEALESLLREAAAGPAPASTGAAGAYEDDLGDIALDALAATGPVGDETLDFESIEQIGLIASDRLDGDTARGTVVRFGAAGGDEIARVSSQAGSAPSGVLGATVPTAGLDKSSPSGNGDGAPSEASEPNAGREPGEGADGRDGGSGPLDGGAEASGEAPGDDDDDDEDLAASAGGAGESGETGGAEGAGGGDEESDDDGLVASGGENGGPEGGDGGVGDEDDSAASGGESGGPDGDEDEDEDEDDDLAASGDEVGETGGAESAGGGEEGDDDENDDDLAASGGEAGDDDDGPRDSGGKNESHGKSRDDYLNGGDGDDRLFGGAGDGVLDGGAGDDVLNGGSGDNILIGGPGADVLKGGAGADMFVLEFDYAGALDVIFDFKPKQGDVLNLHNLLADETGAVPGLDANSIDGYLRFTTQGHDTILSVDTSGSASSFAAVAVLDGIRGLDAGILFEDGAIDPTAPFG